MSVNAPNSDKGDAVPDKAYLRHCREYKINTGGKAEDNLNGSLPLRESDLVAQSVKPGEYVLLYAEANGKHTWSRRKVHNNGRTITLDSSMRADLELEGGDTVEYWIGKIAETDEAENAGETSNTRGRSKDDDEKDSNTPPTDDEKLYVFVTDSDSMTFHHVESREQEQTVCGIKYGNNEYRTTTEPGVFLDECPDCMVQSGREMSNEELVKWLSKKIEGFEVEGDTPAYLTKSQLSAIRDYVLEQEQTQQAQISSIGAMTESNEE